MANLTPDLWLLFISLFVLISGSQQNDLSVEQLHIQSVITHRFSTTHVTSVVANDAEESREATFDIRLPKAAFISNFSMLIDGVVFPGEVAEKANAKKMYDAAVGRGESAGHVRSSPRQSNKFAVSVNVAAGKNVTFDLIYQELLQRKLGVYEHVLYIDPGQTVPDFMVEVYIVESRMITDLSVPQITNDLLTDEIIDDTNEYAYVERLSPSSAYVSFWPSEDEQRRFSDQGVSGQFIINYDVEHESDGVGEILVSNGYFVHYFAPVWLEPMSKSLIFVLDTSGSMSGKKIVQMKQALVTILDDLSPGDEFGILTFSSNVNPWYSGEMLPASEENVFKAKQYAETLRATGGTNINSALLTGLDLVSTETEKAAMMIFLTDGQASSGVTGSKNILQNVREANDNQVPIFSLAFGEGADFDLLKSISAQNYGVARKIFEDADATLQLAGFYDEVSSPLLSDIKIKYIGQEVENASLTDTNLHCLYDGSEMVVAGKLKDYNDTSVNGTAPTINLVIEGDYIDNTLVLEEDIYLSDSEMEDLPKLSPEHMNQVTQRLWVYLTIKQLIDRSLQSTDPAQASAARDRALALSLKYGFVTPLTSMVVTKPGEDDEKVKQVVGKKPYEDTDILEESYPISPSFPSYNKPGVYRQSSVYAYGLPDLSGAFHPRAMKPQLSFDISGIRTTTPPSRRYMPSTYAATRTTTTTRSPYRYPVTKPTVAPKRVSSKYPPTLSMAVNIKGSPGVNICFDLPKSTPVKPVYTLLKGDIDISGSSLSTYTDGRKFQKIVVKTDNNTATFTTKGVTFGSNRMISWWQLKFSKDLDGEILKDGSVKITSASNSSITINKHGVKSRRSRVKPFLSTTIHINDPSQQPEGVLSGILNSPPANLVNRREIVYQSAKSPIYEYSAKGKYSCLRLTSERAISKTLNL